MATFLWQAVRFIPKTSIGFKLLMMNRNCTSFMRKTLLNRQMDIGKHLKTMVVSDFLLFGRQFPLLGLHLKDDYLDFSHLTKSKNIYITEIYMKKQYKSSRIKNHKNYKKKNFF